MTILTRIKKAIRAYRSGPTQIIPTEEEFRAVGFTPFAAEFPRDELAIRMLAAFNNYPQDKLPEAMKFFPNESTARAWGRVADAAREHLSSKAKQQVTA